MIKIPFERCVIFSTLEFDRLMHKLTSAIYDPYLSQYSMEKPKHQSYWGQVDGSKFLATRIIGHKYIHLPLFLSPTIEGKIVDIHHGYEISLTVKLQNLTFIFLLAWLGGLVTTISFAIDKILGGIANGSYFTSVGISLLIYLLTIGYFYFSAWRSIRFFRYLFVQKLTGFATAKDANDRPWVPNIQHIPSKNSATYWLKENLPSFPSSSNFKN